MNIRIYTYFDKDIPTDSDALLKSESLFYKGKETPRPVALEIYKEQILNVFNSKEVKVEEATAELLAFEYYRYSLNIKANECKNQEAPARQYLKLVGALRKLKEGILKTLKEEGHNPSAVRMVYNIESLIASVDKYEQLYGSKLMVQSFYKLFCVGLFPKFFYPEYFRHTVKPIYIMVNNRVKVCQYYFYFVWDLILSATASLNKTERFELLRPLIHGNLVAGKTAASMQQELDQRKDHWGLYYWLFAKDIDVLNKMFLAQEDKYKDDNPKTRKLYSDSKAGNVSAFGIEVEYKVDEDQIIPFQQKGIFAEVIAWNKQLIEQGARIADR